MSNTWEKARDAFKAKKSSYTFSFAPNGGWMEKGFAGYFMLRGEKTSMNDIVGTFYRDGRDREGDRGRELPTHLIRPYYDSDSYYKDNPDNRGWVFPVFDGNGDIQNIAQRLGAGVVIVHVEYEERVTSCDLTQTDKRDVNSFGAPIKDRVQVFGHWYVNHHFSRFDVYKVDANGRPEFIAGIAGHLGAFDQDNVSWLGGNSRGISSYDISIKTTADAQGRPDSLDVILVDRPYVLDFYGIQCREKFFYRVRIPRLEQGVGIETVNNIRHRLPEYVDYDH